MARRANRSRVPVIRASANDARRTQLVPARGEGAHARRERLAELRRMAPS